MRGDHIYVERSLLGMPVKAAVYTHHGIELDDGRVVHFDGEPSRVKDACVVVSTLEQFLAGGRKYVVKYKRCMTLSRDEIVKRAICSVGARGYHVAFNNCEHFATWCVTGEHKSAQVDRVTQKVVKFIRSGIKKFLLK